jgi:hypothetical protein
VTACTRRRIKRRHTYVIAVMGISAISMNNSIPVDSVERGLGVGSQDDPSTLSTIATTVAATSLRFACHTTGQVPAV